MDKYTMLESQCEIMAGRKDYDGLRRLADVWKDDPRACRMIRRTKSKAQGKLVLVQQDFLFD